MAEESDKPPRRDERELVGYVAGKLGSRRASLRHANLSGADLIGADLIGADLVGADLSGAELIGASLIGADLSGADLIGANLVRANLSHATLRGADLSGARLRYSDLTAADLTDANLKGADLRETILRGANLASADLRGVDLGGATLRRTILVDINLCSLCDADPPIVHYEKSTIDPRSILKSLRSPKLKEFLQKTGTPEVFVEYMVECALSLETDIFKLLRSTFISYGSPDEPFARKLYEALHRNGVTSFFFPEHAVPGKRLHRTMRDGVNEFDRVILVCSKSSLTRGGVLNEIEETLIREAEQGGEPLLIPIALDDYIFNGWSPPDPGTARAVRSRVVADFQSADADQAKFDAGVRKLIAALRK